MNHLQTKLKTMRDYKKYLFASTIAMALQSASIWTIILNDILFKEISTNNANTAKAFHRLFLKI